MSQAGWHSRLGQARETGAFATRALCNNPLTALFFVAVDRFSNPNTPVIMPVESPNVGVAFALVAAAGFATALGASVVFFPALVKLASRRVLAAALGFSAGVMTYVSFVEIFGKSRKAFSAYEETDSNAYLYATLCFFGGVITMLLLDVLVHVLSDRHGHGHGHGHYNHDPPEAENTDDPCGQEASVAEDDIGTVHPCLACSPDPVGDLDKLHHQAEFIIETIEHDGDHAYEGNPSTNVVLPVADTETGSEEAEAQKVEEQRKLIKMGINTAVAIGLHNFPEGLATFVAALDNPRVGAVLAVAIGIHNIPEGLCVALPIYYASGNRTKAFLWALLSGASEPLAALLGWAILAGSFSQQMFAILFGFVAGMMVVISTRELLPTAHRYDPDDTVVTFSFIVGMIVMAMSLVLFTI